VDAHSFQINPADSLVVVVNFVVKSIYMNLLFGSVCVCFFVNATRKQINWVMGLCLKLCMLIYIFFKRMVK